MGVALLVNDNTAIPRGVIQFFFLNYQLRESQNIAEVPLEIYEPYSKVW